LATGNAVERRVRRWPSFLGAFADCALGSLARRTRIASVGGPQGRRRSHRPDFQSLQGPFLDLDPRRRHHRKFRLRRVDASRKCLLGIMSRKFSGSPIGADAKTPPRDVAKYFVPASMIRDFIPTEYRF
jgi:hypothetical protein